MKILIIDDDRAVCSSLDLLLRRKGYETSMIHHPSDAAEAFHDFEPELVLLDMNFTIDTSGKQGLKLLERIREDYPKVSVILMTGWATVQLAVKGMKLGAKDFVAKPWDNKDLLQSIVNVKEIHHRHTDKDNLPSDNAGIIIGESDVMQDIKSIIDKVAPTDASILISGESGTGKELVAESIHLKSKRQDSPFIKVNLGSIPHNLFESEMFGHVKGSFTGAHNDREGRFSVADEGTIFLDEIGELALDSQVKLLRVLQEKTFEKIGSSKTQKVNVRVISATNRDLLQSIDEEVFREDLYYRINLLNIHLPALRERRGDIPLLIKHFLKNISSVYNADRPYVDDSTLEWLSMQPYKGNIRQLKNIVERTYLLNDHKKDLNKKDFESAFQAMSSGRTIKNDLNLQRLEIETIKKALQKHTYSISASARALGITRSALYRRLEKYGISHDPQV